MILTRPNPVRPRSPFGATLRARSLPLALGLVLIVALAVGIEVVRPESLRPQSGSSAYRAEVTRVLVNADAALAEGSRLLDQVDSDPRFGSDPNWLAAHQKIVDALAADYQSVLALRPDSEDGGLQNCVGEGLRLIWTGHAMLHHALQVDGHEAYFNSAHGNWDLNLGVTRLEDCRVILHAGRSEVAREGR